MLMAMESMLASEKSDCGCGDHIAGAPTGWGVGGGDRGLPSTPRDSGIGGTGEPEAGGGGGGERVLHPPRI